MNESTSLARVSLFCVIFGILLRLCLFILNWFSGDRGEINNEISN